MYLLTISTRDEPVYQLVKLISLGDFLSKKNQRSMPRRLQQRNFCVNPFCTSLNTMSPHYAKRWQTVETLRNPWPAELSLSHQKNAPPWTSVIACCKMLTNGPHTEEPLAWRAETLPPKKKIAPHEKMGANFLFGDRIGHCETGNKYCSNNTTQLRNFADPVLARPKEFQKIPPPLKKRKYHLTKPSFGASRTLSLQRYELFKKYVPPRKDSKNFLNGTG